MNLVVGHRYSFDHIVREYCKANKMAMSDLRFEFFYKDTCYPEFDAKPYGSIINGKQCFSKITSRYDRRGFWANGIIFSGYFIKRRSRIKNAPK